MRNTDRSLPLQRRADLVADRILYGREPYWVVKDPLSVRFVRLREPEYAILQMLDGRRSRDEVTAEFEARFPPQRLPSDELEAFLSKLHRAGLVLSSRPGQGIALFEQGKQRRRRAFRSRLLNPLVIRFRGLDPTWLFAHLYPVARPFLSRTAFISSLGFIAAAVLWAAVQWSELSRRLPSADEFFTTSNLIVLSFVLLCLKVAHEFGHGLVNKHFGGESRELGVMLFLFTPCLYCDVADAWSIPSKWKRAAIGAAGIYVELLAASAALFLWWFTLPGLLNQICLAVMTIASIGTLVFNGNPLMRYDGYFILSDLLEIPNLAERSAAVLRDRLARTFLGTPPSHDPQLPKDRPLGYMSFAIASAVYRVAVTASVALLLIDLARSARLELFGRSAAALIGAAVVIPPALRFSRFIALPGRLRQADAGRISATLGLLVALLLTVLFLPLPHRIHGSLELQLRDPQRVFVDTPGIFTSAAVAYGTKAAPGDVIARLKNNEVELELEKLGAERIGIQSQLTSLHRERFEDPELGRSLREVEKVLVSVEEQLVRKQLDRERLTPKSVRAGTVYPPPEISTTASSDTELRNWRGHPLDLENIGCTFDTGVLLCEIGDPHQWEALIVVEQDDIEFIRNGDEAEILFDAIPDQVWCGSVDQVGLGALDYVPPRLAGQAGGEMATRKNDAGHDRPWNTSYLVRVRVDDPAGRLRLGLRGAARIHVASETLSTKISRWGARTFQFRL